MGTNAQTPQIGDLKITLSEVLPQTVSVIAEQTGNTIQPYMTPAGQAVGLLVMGQQGPEQVIQQAASENKMLTWVLRLVSFLMMFFGFSLILRPLVVLAAVLPFLGSLVGFGTGLLAFMGGLFLWALATAFAWFAVRPLWSLGLIVIVLLLCTIIFVSNQKQVNTG